MASGFSLTPFVPSGGATLSEKLPSQFQFEDDGVPPVSEP